MSISRRKEIVSYFFAAVIALVIGLGIAHLLGVQFLPKSELTLCKERALSMDSYCSSLPDLDNLRCKAKINRELNACYDLHDD